MSEIIFHIGAHRCGSTAIQNLLKANMDALVEKGIHCYFRKRIEKHPKLIALHSLHRSSLMVPFANMRVREIAAALNDLGHVIISEENLPGPMVGVKDQRLYPGLDGFMRRLAALKTQLERPMRIIMAVRRQDRMIESLYAFRVTKGYVNSFDAFVKSLSLDDFHWGRLLDAAQKHGLQDQIQFMPLEGMTADTISGMLAVPLAGELSGNSSLKEAQLNLWRAMVVEAVRLSEPKPRQALINYLRQVEAQPSATILCDAAEEAGVDISIEQATNALHRASGMEPALFDAGARAKILARFKDGNATFLSADQVQAPADIWG